MSEESVKNGTFPRYCKAQKEDNYTPSISDTLRILISDNVWIEHNDIVTFNSGRELTEEEFKEFLWVKLNAVDFDFKNLNT